MRNMMKEGISRRDVLRTLAVGAASSSVLQVIPAAATEYVHQMVHKEKAAAPAGKYTPKFFPAPQYATLIALCDTIIPKDEKSGGAVEAGAPEFIDLLASENEKYQLRLGGGLFWLDSFCIDRYGKVFLECTPEQKKEVLDLIACRSGAENRKWSGQAGQSPFPAESESSIAGWPVNRMRSASRRGRKCGKER